MARLTSREKPTFADEVMVSFVIKRTKDNSEKDAVVRLSFVDSLRKEIVSDIVVSPITAKAMITILQKTAEKLELVLSGKIGKFERKPKMDETTYIG